jgi:deoxyribonuclease V
VFVAADVHYLPSGGARAAAVVAADPAFARLAGERTVVVADVAPYQPGQFYLRELPPLRAVLDGLSGLSRLVVDGYADLDPDGRPGLGARACDEFGVPVIGVAKTPFRTATHAIAVLRGTSARPLYGSRGRRGIRRLGWSSPSDPFLQPTPPTCTSRRTCAGLSLCCRSSAVCRGGATGRISGKRPRCSETVVVGATKPNARGTGRAGSRLLLRCGHPPHREAGTTGRSH